VGNHSQLQIIGSVFVVAVIFGAFLLSTGTIGRRIDAAPAASRSPAYHVVGAEKAKEIMDSGDPYLLLDVRTESEYAEKRIIGAILLPSSEIDNKAESVLPEKTALILVYCRSGARSAAASAKLAEMGYANIYDIGGIMAWPYETESG